MYKLVVFIPKTHANQVKQALFEAGAGRQGNYDCCSFETIGTGQFRPLEGSNPFLGDMDKIEIVEELRVEMLCAEESIRPVLSALRKSHPYEEPAFDVIKLIDTKSLEI